MTAPTLDHEIARINKMHLPASMRSDLVRRARAVWSCIPQPGPTARDPWCGRCGHLLSDHPRVRETWVAEDEVRTLPTRPL